MHISAKGRDYESSIKERREMPLPRQVEAGSEFYSIAFWLLAKQANKIRPIRNHIALVHDFPNGFVISTRYSV